MDKHKIFAVLGSLAVAVLPILGHMAFAANPTVHMALEGAAALLAVLGFAVTKPLFASADAGVSK